ncbi:hypothetical protein GEO21_04865 [Sphingobacterium faecium]|nr:hypothetical protein [Sphingobacterium faecium]
MHCLYRLQILGFQFELKCGTSLSKPYIIIDRLSEDIDIHPDSALGINENPKNTHIKNVAICQTIDLNNFYTLFESFQHLYI